MRKIIKGVAWVSVAALVIAFSIRLEPLDERQTGSFDPMAQVDRFWQEELPKLLVGDRVVDADLFRAELKNNRKLLIDRYGLTLGIGAPYSMLVGAEFEVKAVNEELVRIVTTAGTAFDLRRSFIFGNTVREVTGCFSIDDYDNTMDFNHIASALNDCVFERVAEPAAALFEVGRRLRVVGAVDVDQAGNLKPCYELIPLSIQPVDHE